MIWGGGRGVFGSERGVMRFDCAVHRAAHRPRTRRPRPPDVPVRRSLLYSYHVLMSLSPLGQAGRRHQSKLSETRLAGAGTRPWPRKYVFLGGDLVLRNASMSRPTHSARLPGRQSRTSA